MNLVVELVFCCCFFITITKYMMMIRFGLVSSEDVNVDFVVDLCFCRRVFQACGWIL